MGERYWITGERKYSQKRSSGSWKKEHIPWNKGLTTETDEKLKGVGKRISLNAKHNPKYGNKGKRFSEKHRKKLAIKHIGKHLSEETKQKISIANTGRKYTDEINKKKGLKGNKNPFFGKRHSKKTKDILHTKAKEWWKLTENRQKILNDEMLKRRLKGLIKRPTSLEKRLIDIIQENNLPYKYTGNGSFIIGFKNPDFINMNSQKKCIEVRPKKMCHIWSKCSPDVYKKRQEEHYKKYGWDCIVIWEEDLKNTQKIVEVLQY
ncbi:MAG: NUMOD3 domain-containing DNA-binding protein [Candidatus Nanoarchaeia archaeon]|jgi:hypothetical protein